MYASKKDKPREEWISIEFPALISTDQWQQIQDRIQNQRLKPKRKYKGYEEHFMLEGFIVCGECGARMGKAVKIEKNGKARLYYKCFWHTAGKQDKALSGRSTCHLKSVNADDVDNEIFNQVSELLVRPSRFTQAWLKDLDREELERNLKRLEQREQELQGKLRAQFMIVDKADDLELEIYRDEHQKTLQTWKDIRRELDKARNDYNFVLDKAKRMEGFAKKLNKIGISTRFKTQGLFKGYLNALPFTEKKRIVEAIISPENGGKIEIAYIRPSDFLDAEELKEIIPEELEGKSVAEIEAIPSDELRRMVQEAQNRPLKDRKCRVTGDFNINFEKIESVINSLDTKPVLNVCGEYSIAKPHIDIAQAHVLIVEARMAGDPSRDEADRQDERKKGKFDQFLPDMHKRDSGGEVDKGLEEARPYDGVNIAAVYLFEKRDGTRDNNSRKTQKILAKRCDNARKGKGCRDGAHKRYCY
jgi:hypothetical protein